MRVVALMACALLLPVQESSEVSKWIEDLGHDEVARRDAAQAQLLKAGEKALPVLRKSMATPDSEKVARLKWIIEEIERPGRERLHDAAQRASQLRIVTIDVKNALLAEALASLERQGPTRIKSYLKDERRVTLSFKDAPLDRCLDAIEDQIDVSIRLSSDSGMYEVTRSRVSRRPRGYTPGVTFTLSTRPFEVGDAVNGIRVKVNPTGPAEAFIESWEAVGRDGKPCKVSRCPPCGPQLGLVEIPTEQFRIRLKGRVVWHSRYEFAVADPTVPQAFRVGTTTVSYEFPKVALTGSERVEIYRFPYASLAGVWKEGRKPDDRIGGVFGLGMGPAGRKRAEGVWCDCPAGAKVEPKPPELISSREFSGYTGAAASDFESMKVIVHRPIEEPFETEIDVSTE
jgi:hypothetical protein